MKISVVSTVLVAVYAGSAAAEQGRTTFAVAVTVPVRVTLDVVEAPVALEITSQDVARGYKDVAVHYRVHHNDRRGYLLEIAPLDHVAQWIEVRGLDDTVVVRDDAVAIRRSGAEFDQDLALEMHFVLDPATQVGTFALPVRIAAKPV